MIMLNCERQCFLVSTIHLLLYNNVFISRVCLVKLFTYNMSYTNSQISVESILIL